MRILSEIFSGICYLVSEILLNYSVFAIRLRNSNTIPSCKLDWEGILGPGYVMDVQPKLRKKNPPSALSGIIGGIGTQKLGHGFLVAEPYHRQMGKDSSLAAQKEYARQEFLLIGGVIFPRLAPLLIVVP